MAQGSDIEWTESTWNPVTGCTKISPGCKRCYAKRMAERLRAMGQANYANGFNLTLQPHMLEIPLRWKKPQTIFVNSMSDLFHEDVPIGYIRQVFDVMARAHWHRFQVLTKRANRLAELSPRLAWASNIWMGVSVENAKYAYRIDELRSAGSWTAEPGIRCLTTDQTNSSVKPASDRRIATEWGSPACARIISSPVPPSGIVFRRVAPVLKTDAEGAFHGYHFPCFSL